MDESQIAVLPPDLATEAQSLRREWESRNRQLLHERFFTHGGYSAGTALSSILRNSGMRLTSRYGLQTAIAGRPAWAQPWPRGPAAIAAQHMLMTSKIKGKQLVDNEALSCLLVLLFLDDPRLNTGRLHRVLRNLCYHSNTRQWVIRVRNQIKKERDGEFCCLPIYFHVLIETWLFYFSPFYQLWRGRMSVADYHTKSLYFLLPQLLSRDLKKSTATSQCKSTSRLPPFIR